MCRLRRLDRLTTAPGSGPATEKIETATAAPPAPPARRAAHAGNTRNIPTARPAAWIIRYVNAVRLHSNTRPTDGQETAVTGGTAASGARSDRRGKIAPVGAIGVVADDRSVLQHGRLAGESGVSPSPRRHAPGGRPR